MDIADAIRNRTSVRNYAGCALTGHEREEIESAIMSAQSPFGGSVTIKLADFDLRGPYKPSTYGVITGSRTFLLMAYGDDDVSALSAGFMMEGVVLRATALGLGTCWVGGTFKGSTFDREIDWPEGESLRIISPVGKPAGRKSLLSRLSSAMLRSRSRKTWSELFYDGDFSRSLTGAGSRYGEALEMMRMAPSSVNSQPWRAIVDGNRVHFYVKAKGSFYMIDMGIGLRHFAAVAHDGEFYDDSEAPKNEALRYVVSYRQ